MAVRAFLVLALLYTSNLHAGECAPDRMLHVTTTVTQPDSQSFAAKPKELYRSGSTMGRVEEQLDPENKLHLLFVVNEPDVWVVNRYDGTGRHMTDPGPSLVFSAPILEPELRESWDGFEFGCEVDFLEKAGAERIVLSPHAVKYSLRIAETEVALFTDPSARPLKLEVKGADAYTVTYLTYEYLDLDLSLFSRPTGVTFSEESQ